MVFVKAKLFQCRQLHNLVLPSWLAFGVKRLPLCALYAVCSYRYQLCLEFRLGKKVIRCMVGDFFPDIRRFRATLVLLRSILPGDCQSHPLHWTKGVLKALKTWLCQHPPLHKEGESLLQDFLWDCGHRHFLGGCGWFLKEDSLTVPLLLVTICELTELIREDQVVS